MVGGCVLREPRSIVPCVTSERLPDGRRDGRGVRGRGSGAGGIHTGGRPRAGRLASAPSAPDPGSMPPMSASPAGRPRRRCRRSWRTGWPGVTARRGEGGTPGAARSALRIRRSAAAATGDIWSPPRIAGPVVAVAASVVEGTALVVVAAPSSLRWAAPVYGVRPTIPARSTNRKNRPPSSNSNTRLMSFGGRGSGPSFSSMGTSSAPVPVIRASGDHTRSPRAPVPPGRRGPRWGTRHAIWVAFSDVDGPRPA